MAGTKSSLMGARRRRFVVAAAIGTAFAVASHSVAFGEGMVGVGVTGAEGTHVAVAPNGNASSSQGVAVSGTGQASGGGGAVSGTNTANSGIVAVSGAGTANASTVAASGAGDANQSPSGGCAWDPSGAALVSPGGAAASGIGDAQGCNSADALLTWVDTPDGPVGVGPAIGTVTALAKAVVAGVQDVVAEKTYTVAEVEHDLPEPYVHPLPPPDPVTQPLEFVDWLTPPAPVVGTGNYESGCAASATCNGLYAKTRHRMPVDYYHPQYSFRMFHGIVVGTYLVPEQPASNGKSYDAFHVFTTMTGDESGICGINNYAREEGGNEAFFHMAPTGTQDVGSGQNVNIGVTVGPFSFGTSWTSYSGRIRGDYDPGSAKATGSWTYRKNSCPYNGNSATMASGASYEWPRGVGRSYQVGAVLTYQIR